MNYIAEIKAFYDRLELNPLPSPAIALWHALMSIANKTGWQQEFTVAVSVLMLKSGLNAQAIKRARNRLEQDGYITWRSRGGNQAAVYHLNSLVVQNEVKNVPQCEPQSVPITKHKLNETKTPPISPVERFAEFAAAYPKKCTGYLAESEYCNAVMAGVPEDDLIRAARNYADACRRDRTAERYIKKAENWLRENVFMQYLKGAGNGADGTNAGENTTAHEKSINERLGELGDTGEFEGF